MTCTFPKSTCGRWQHPMQNCEAEHSMYHNVVNIEGRGLSKFWNLLACWQPSQGSEHIYQHQAEL
jgi:hypothetical protein